MSRSSTLVTGAAGFAGAHLLDALARTTPPAQLHGWARSSVRPAPTHNDIQWRGVDLLDAGAVSRAIADVKPTEIYHLAGASHTGASWDRPAEYLEIHVSGTHHVLEAVRVHAPQCRVLVI